MIADGRKKMQNVSEKTDGDKSYAWLVGPVVFRVVRTAVLRSGGRYGVRSRRFRVLVDTVCLSALVCENIFPVERRMEKNP